MKVASALREKYPDVTMMIAADNDHHLPLRDKPLPNKGLEKAKEAAHAIDGYVIIPPLNTKEKAKGLTDWNDLAQERGMEKTAARFIEQAREALGLGKLKERQHEVARSKEQSRSMEMV